MQVVSNEVLYTWTQSDRLAYYKELGRQEPHSEAPSRREQGEVDGCGCSCRHGIFVAGWCSSCGSDQDNRYIENVDAWYEPDTGYATTEPEKALDYLGGDTSVENVNKTGRFGRTKPTTGRPKVSAAHRRRTKREQQRRYRAKVLDRT